MNFEKEMFNPGGVDDQNLAKLHVERQTEQVAKSEETERHMSDQEVRHYILDHKKVFESRDQIIRLIELRAMMLTIPTIKDHIENQLIPTCIHYTETVAEFDIWAKKFSEGEMTGEEFEEKSNSRSRTHDAMIADFNVVIREARKEMGDQPWMDKFDNRSDYAKLALQIAAEKMLAS